MANANDTSSSFPLQKLYANACLFRHDSKEFEEMLIIIIIIIG